MRAITGDNLGDRWYVAEERAETTTKWFLAFICGLLTEIGPHTVHCWCCFILDNLNIHHNQVVVDSILNAIHCIVWQAPYNPKDGPIEYFLILWRMLLL